MHEFVIPNFFHSFFAIKISSLSPNRVFCPEPYCGKFANSVLNNEKNLKLEVENDTLNLTFTK